MLCTYCGEVLTSKAMRYGESRFCHNRCYVNFSQFGSLAWKKQAATSFVYLLECQGWFKIGFADDPLRRVRDLQTGNPFKITLLHSVPCLNYEKVETYLHVLYREHRGLGEWFKLSAEAVETITALTTDACHEIRF